MNKLDGSVAADIVIIDVISRTGQPGLRIIMRIPELLVDIGCVGRSGTHSPQASGKSDGSIETCRTVVIHLRNITSQLIVSQHFIRTYCLAEIRYIRIVCRCIVDVSAIHHQEAIDHSLRYGHAAPASEFNRERVVRVISHILGCHCPDKLFIGLNNTFTVEHIGKRMVRVDTTRTIGERSRRNIICQRIRVLIVRCHCEQ